jgi:beta-galactosidase
MKNLIFLGAISASLLLGSCGKLPVRSRESFNENWKFHPGDTTGVEKYDFIDTRWRDLNLPHDWSIEGKFDVNNPATPSGGALPGGIAWYRKTFEMPSAAKGKKVFIDFDGIYRNAEVWINGHSLGMRPNGYISYRYDLTPYLVFDHKNNVIAVRVDNSKQPNSRWYSGSGIYRNVWMVTTNNLHVDHWGTFISTPLVNKDSANILITSTIINEGSKGEEFEIRTTLFTNDSSKAGFDVKPMKLESNSRSEISQHITIANPRLWSVEHPVLYRAVTQIYKKKKLIDEYNTPFGVRNFSFDADSGFSLNGKPVKIYGVCIHHDMGALGAALNLRALERQLDMLKAMGCNGIRTSHNPPAPELLDLCDRMGFIVIDEAFDMWKKPKNPFDYHLDWDKWHVRDLEDQLLRDRNHPSVFVWSIGNEIREQSYFPDGKSFPPDSSGLAITRELADIVHKLDPTRPVIAALDQVEGKTNAVIQSGALDIIGYNYRHLVWKDVQKKWAKKPFMATEAASAFESRGDYHMPSDRILRAGNGKQNLSDDFTASSYDNYSAVWASTHEESLKEFFRLPFVAGTFIWTGWDYLGEPTPYGWPARSSYFGIIDLAGFPKDAYYLYQSVWTKKPVLHVFPHWNWKNGQVIDVWAYYNNADEVELFLNDRSIGVRKKENGNLHVMWRTIFEPGKITAVSRKNGKIVLTREIKTAGEPFKVSLSADRKSMHKDGKDLTFITVKILDDEGNLVPHASNLVKFSCTGEANIAGVDNGFQASIEPFKADYRKAYNGMCLVIVQSTAKSGKAKIVATSEGLKEASVEVDIQ